MGVSNLFKILSACQRKAHLSKATQVLAPGDRSREWTAGSTSQRSWTLEEPTAPGELVNRRPAVSRARERLLTEDPGKLLARPEAVWDQASPKPLGVTAKGIPSGLLMKTCTPISAPHAPLKTERDTVGPPDRLPQP